MIDRKVYFALFSTLWDAKGYYRIRGDHLILQVIKAVPAIDIARGHVKGKRVAKGLPPMQIPLPAGADPLEVLKEALSKVERTYDVRASYRSVGSLTPLRY